MIPEGYIGPYIATNLIAAGLIVAAIKWPRRTRILFAFIFLLAGLVNAYTAITDPKDYLNYREFAVLDTYKEFIDGFFKKHTQPCVLAIALGQLITGILLLMKNDRLRGLGVIGGAIFFVAIIPLGIGSAFPCPLLSTVALNFMAYRLSGNH